MRSKRPPKGTMNRIALLAVLALCLPSPLSADDARATPRPRKSSQLLHTDAWSTRSPKTSASSVNEAGQRRAHGTHPVADGDTAASPTSRRAVGQDRREIGLKAHRPTYRHLRDDLHRRRDEPPSPSTRLPRQLVPRKDACVRLAGLAADPGQDRHAASRSTTQLSKTSARIRPSATSALPVHACPALKLRTRLAGTGEVTAVRRS